MKTILKKILRSKIVEGKRQHGTPVRSLIDYMGTVVKFNDVKRGSIINIVDKIKDTIPTLTTTEEMYNIAMLIQATAKLHGDIAEVGVYQGGTAFLMKSLETDKSLHLFDTFAGLPKSEGRFSKGQACASLELVKKNLYRFNNNIYYHPGLFPDTAENIKNKTFSFVHLDMDLSDGTLAALDFFYPRMSKGGIILIHDYQYIPIMQAVIDDFFKDKYNPIIEIGNSQCMVVV